MGYPPGEVPIRGVQGATYAVPILGKYYQMVFGARQIPDFPQPPLMPAWVAWGGSHSVASATPIPSPTPSSVPATPSPAPTQPPSPVSYTHLRAHETRHDLVC